MGGEPVSGVERVVFAGLTREEIDDWLVGHVRTRLGARVAGVIFRAGRVAAVYGLRLTGGGDVVVKVHRAPVDTRRLEAAAACQRVLADAGYPCPLPVDGPATTGGRTALIEALLDEGEPGDAHDPGVRRALARSLAAQVETLRGVPPGPLAAGRPAWAVYEGGPWPAPHDPVFDFAGTPAGYEWLDGLARRASTAMGPPGAPAVVGHGDWACQNVRFADGQVIAGYDWDSVIAVPEAVLAGLSAGAHTEGSTRGATAPTPMEVGAFLTDYDQAREMPFTGAEQAVAAAAATWVLAYNARCEIGYQAPAGEPEAESLRMLSRHRDAYLRTRW